MRVSRQLLLKEKVVMRKVMVVLAALAAIVAGTAAMARGGQSADDCPPGSTDPDCR